MKKLTFHKRIDSLVIYFITFCYLEILFKIISHSFFSWDLINNILFIIILTLGCKFITSLFSSKVNKILMYVIISIISLFYAVQIVVHNIFNLYFDFSLLGATDQVLKFTGDMISLILKNFFYLVIIFLPIIVMAFINDNIKTKQITFKKNIIFIPIAIGVYGLFLLSLNINKNKDYSAYNLFYNSQNVELSLKRLGVVHTMFIDLNRYIFGFDANIDFVPSDLGEEVTNKDNDDVKVYDYNNLDIDFDSLIASSSGNVKKMHEYFKSDAGTLQNEYTGFFKDKNLILFMAESFNEIAVDKELTPTLYKLVNSGFVFPNFYTPTISSTIGGEFQELTGLVAASGFLSPWKSGENSYPFGIANMFKNAGYNTFAYHDHTYTFQSRNKYLAALGFTNYLGCRNGLEERINCNLWPESDIEMINSTFDDYINSDKPFFTYYVTVSGHGGYSWSGNAMSRKNKDLVADLDYTEAAKAYIASQIELDRALETLLQKLEASGKLDDTVIALVGDHYPYLLPEDDVNSITKNKKDFVIEINHSNFILWNNKMETVNVEKVGSQIDVLPTIYNVFGLDYDSRLIIGKDILSTTPGVAIFGNSSWVSDYGTYYTATGKFVPKEGKEISDDYVSKMNKMVNNRVSMSKLIMTEDYYKYFK